MEQQLQVGKALEVEEIETEQRAVVAQEGGERAGAIIRV
jgi:hypothetical protein